MTVTDTVNGHKIEFFETLFRMEQDASKLRLSAKNGGRVLSGVGNALLSFN